MVFYRNSTSNWDRWKQIFYQKLPKLFNFLSKEIDSGWYPFCNGLNLKHNFKDVRPDPPPGTEPDPVPLQFHLFLKDFTVDFSLFLLQSLRNRNGFGVSAIDAIPLSDPQKEVSSMRLLEMFLHSGAHFSFDYRDLFSKSHLELISQISKWLPLCFSSLHRCSFDGVALVNLKFFVFLLLAGIFPLVLYTNYIWF